MGFLKSALIAGSLISNASYAAKCEVTVKALPGMKFDSQEIVIPDSCKSFKLTLTNTDTLPKAAMGHNLVITETSKVQDAVKEAMTAGLGGDYRPKNVIASTKLLGPSESDTFTLSEKQLTAIAGKDISFVCTFPGHFAMMKGAVKYKMSSKKS